MQFFQAPGKDGSHGPAGTVTPCPAPRPPPRHRRRAHAGPGSGRACQKRKGKKENNPTKPTQIIPSRGGRV